MLSDDWPDEAGRAAYLAVVVKRLHDPISNFRMICRTISKRHGTDTSISLRRWCPSLHKYCRRLTGNLWDVEDRSRICCFVPLGRSVVIMISFTVRCSPWLRVEETGLGILL